MCGVAHLWALQRWKQALIAPKRHSIHSERWQPSLFSKESTLSLLHSSRAHGSAWWIMLSVSSKTRLILDRYTTLYKMLLTACRSQRGQKRVNKQSDSTLCPGWGCLRWFQTFSFSSNVALRLWVFCKNVRCYIVSLSRNLQQKEMRLTPQVYLFCYLKTLRLLLWLTPHKSCQHSFAMRWSFLFEIC